MIHIEAWPSEGAALDDWLSKNFPPGGTNEIHARNGLLISGQPAVTMTGYEKIGPPPYVETRLWWVASPFFQRVYRIQMWPAEHPLLADVQRMIASLRLFAPTVVTPPVTVSPALALDLSRVDPRMTKVDRIETKLVTFWDYEKAVGSFTYGLSGPDPDRLLWVSVILGDMDPSIVNSMRGLFPPPTPEPGQAYVEVSIDANTGAVGGGAMGLRGGWPAWFDKLHDRCIRGSGPAVRSISTSALTREAAIAAVRGLKAEVLRVDQIGAVLTTAERVYAGSGATALVANTTPIWAVAVRGQIRIQTVEALPDAPCAVYFFNALDGSVIGMTAGDVGKCDGYLKPGGAK